MPRGKKRQRRCRIYFLAWSIIRRRPSFDVQWCGNATQCAAAAADDGDVNERSTLTTTRLYDDAFPHLIISRNCHPLRQVYIVAICRRSSDGVTDAVSVSFMVISIYMLYFKEWIFCHTGCVPFWIIWERSSMYSVEDHNYHSSSTNTQKIFCLLHAQRCYRQFTRFTQL